MHGVSPLPFEKPRASLRVLRRAETKLETSAQNQPKEPSRTAVFPSAVVGSKEGTGGPIQEVGQQEEERLPYWRI